MEEGTSNCESLTLRIQQLERERDELRKDIEQLCLQQAGPSYLVVATRMHFQRTASLEQEIENLKMKLAVCSRDNQNLQEELSEVYRIKSQLADLHSAELSKNMEAEKQLKFFQNCVAAAFAERDNSIMEAEKAKEQEEALSQKVIDTQQRLEELTEVCNEEKERNSVLQDKVKQLEKQSEISEMLINKFYEIRQDSFGCFEDKNVEEKCMILLEDRSEKWSFDCHDENSTSKYIASLEEELATSMKNVESLHKKMRMGLEIEEHLRKKVSTMEEKLIHSDKTIKNELSQLRCFHTRHRCEVMDILQEEKIQLVALFDEVNEKIKQFQITRTHGFEAQERDAVSDDIGCRDVHITNDGDPTMPSEDNNFALSGRLGDETVNTSHVLVQAMQEKVAALLLLSQQEERHMLERDVNAALQKKIEDLQKKLFQVTNEKVKALMELAQVRHDYQILQQNINSGKKGHFSYDVDKSIATDERDGKLKSLLRRTALRRWVGRFDLMGNESGIPVNNDESTVHKRKDFPVEFARLKIENATLKESRASMEYLTSSIHKLRLSLLKVKETATSLAPASRMMAVVDKIISEANVVKIALGSSLPLSWSAEADPESPRRNLEKSSDSLGESSEEKVDYVSAAGFEMVELLLLAAHLLKDGMTEKSCHTD